MHFIIQWIDLIWLPLAWFVVHKPQRWWTLGTLASCMLMLRLQAELMESIGYPQGILPFMDSHVFSRGLGVYAIYYVIYLLIAYYSPDSKGALFMGVSLSVFFMAFFTAIAVMVL